VNEKVELRSRKSHPFMVANPSLSGLEQSAAGAAAKRKELHHE
jgi:hypothetical protein